MYSFYMNLDNSAQFMDLYKIVVFSTRWYNYYFDLL